MKKLSWPTQHQQPIFILGTGRSGTTILGRILSVHPDIGFLNEPKALWYAVTPQDDLIGTYAKVGGRYFLDEQDATLAAKEAATRLYAAYAFLTRSRRIVDKYPEMIFRAAFLKAVFPQAKLVLIVRNGWDTLSSINQWSVSQAEMAGATLHNWWGIDNYKWRLLLDQVVPKVPLLASLQSDLHDLKRQQDMAAVEWIATMRQGQAVLASFPNDTFMLRYEALTRHPRQQLSRLQAFCQLRSDDVLLRYAEEILHPNPSKPAVALHPLLEQPFRQMMQQMDYMS